MYKNLYNTVAGISIAWKFRGKSLLPAEKIREKFKKTGRSEALVAIILPITISMSEILQPLQQPLS